MTPAPHRQAWLMRPCGRRMILGSGFNPGTDPGLLHPVTERYSLLSSHLAVAVGSGSLPRTQLAHEYHTAPARAGAVSSLRTPTALGSSLDLDPYIGTTIHPQYFQGAGLGPVLRLIAV